MSALMVLIWSLGASLPRRAFADIGQQGASFSGTSTPTGTKRAESVLWRNHHVWWASMWDASSRDFHIFRFRPETLSWADTEVTIDARSNAHADVLWDGTHLYVASHLFVNDGLPAASGSASRLYRFSYDRERQTYSPDSGFPVTINDYKTETLVIEKDSTGKLWATWQQDGKIYVNRTTGDDRSWGTPFVVPVGGSGVTVDDNSSLISFGGDKLGLMWSNQDTSQTGMYFAVHEDGQPDTSWEPSRRVVQGPLSADDHINLKRTSDGRVLAAVKTEFSSPSTAPLIQLLVRDPASGEWSAHTIGRVADCHNRPIVMIDEQGGFVHVLATGPGPPSYACNSVGGAIYEKTAPLDAIAFTSGLGAPVILDADSAAVHNVGSTKQRAHRVIGMLALAINGSTQRYWYHFDPLGGLGLLSTR